MAIATSQDRREGLPPSIARKVVQYERFRQVVRWVISLWILSQTATMAYSGLYLRSPNINSFRVASAWGAWVWVGAIGVIWTLVLLSLRFRWFRYPAAGAYIAFCMAAGWSAWRPEYTFVYTVFAPMLGALLVFAESIHDDH